MVYIRVSIAHPRRGEEARLEELMRKIASLVEADGATNYILKPHDGSGEIARITIYENEAQAEHAAVTATMMALRSEVNLATDGNHTERAFFSI